MGRLDPARRSSPLVEPAAFLKISALGVEEQRVNVIADFTSPLEQRRTLGDGYRIEARIEVDQVTDVVKVPAGALFRVNDGWHVFLIVRGRAKLQPVEVGMSSGVETEIRQGVGEGRSSDSSSDRRDCRRQTCTL